MTSSKLFKELFSTSPQK